MGRRDSRRTPRKLRATRPGWCFVAIIFGVGFAALNTGNNLLYLVFALMLAFLVLSGLLSEASLRGIEVERRLPRELFAGQPNPVGLRIRNRQRRVPAFALSIDDRLAPAGAGAARDRAERSEARSAERSEARSAVGTRARGIARLRAGRRAREAGPTEAGRTFVLRIAPDATIERHYEWIPPSRGEHAFESIRISTRFPFGLFVKSLELVVPGRALVYPAIHPTPRPACPDPARHPETAARSGRTTMGDAVGTIREFIRGDSPARIHWRRSLRSGRLVVGEREGDAGAIVEVLLALGTGLSAEGAEQRISQAASEVVHHLEAGHRVGLVARAARFAPDVGPAHRRALLAFLARVEPESEATSARLREDSA